MKKITLFSLLSLVGLMQITGCGSGSGGGAIATEKTAVVSFSVMSTSRLPFRIEGVQLSALLPSGVTVVTDPASNKITSGSLVGGSTTANALVFGSYSAPIQKVKIDVAQVNPGFGPGEFARLTCNVVPGTTLTESDFVNKFAPSFAFKATYYDSVAGQNVDLYPGKLQAPTIKVTFTY